MLSKYLPSSLFEAGPLNKILVSQNDFKFLPNHFGTILWLTCKVQYLKKKLEIRVSTVEKLDGAYSI